MRNPLLLMPFALLLSLTSCTQKTNHPTSPPHASIHLTATLLSPVDVQLQWIDSNPTIAGHIVEYANTPTDDFVTLAFLPPTQSTFTHPNLIPHTSFYYRVRAYTGPASSPLSISLPATLTDQEFSTRFNAPEDYTWAQPKSLPTGPATLHATPVPTTVSGFLFTWTNHALDADGLLLEIKLPQSPDFEVAALIPPTTNSFGWALEYPTRTATLRIRPIKYSPPSNIPSILTGTARNHP